MNPTGAQYCGNFTGDYWPQLYKNQAALFFKSKAAKLCNNAADIGMCAKMWWDSKNAAKLVYYEYMAMNHVAIQGADLCVMEAIFFTYNQVDKFYHAYTHAARLAISFIVVGILV